MTVDDGRGPLDRPGAAHRPAGPGVHPGARRLDDVPRRAAQARPGRSSRRRRRPVGAGRAPRSTRARSHVGTGTVPVAARRGPAARQASRCPPPTGRAAPGSTPASAWARDQRPAVAPGPPLRRPATPGRPARRPAPARGVRRAARGHAPRTPTPTSCCPRLLRAHGTRGPRRRVRHRAGLRHARAAGRRTTRCSPPASTGRSTGSTPRCSTCCASAPTSCSAMRVPPTPPSPPRRPVPRPGRPRTGRFVNAVLRKVADSRSTPGCGSWRPTLTTDPIGLAARQPRPTPAGSSPRWRTRSAATVGTSCRSCSPPTTTRRGHAGRAARGSARWRSWSRPAARPRHCRRTASGCSGGDPGGVPRSPRAGPASRTRAPSSSPRARHGAGRGRGRAVARPVRRARAARRRCSVRSRPNAAPGCWRSSASRTGPSWSAARGRAARLGRRRS